MNKDDEQTIELLEPVLRLQTEQPAFLHRTNGAEADFGQVAPASLVFQVFPEQGYPQVLAGRQVVNTRADFILLVEVFQVIVQVSCFIATS